MRKQSNIYYGCGIVKYFLIVKKDQLTTNENYHYECLAHINGIETEKG